MEERKIESSKENLALLNTKRVLNSIAYYEKISYWR